MRIDKPRRIFGSAEGATHSGESGAEMLPREMGRLHLGQLFELAILIEEKGDSQ
jgi:hypothetical protein